MGAVLALTGFRQMRAGAVMLEINPGLIASSLGKAQDAKKGPGYKQKTAQEGD